MHRNSFVVSLYSAHDNKPLKEYANSTQDNDLLLSRSRDIFIPPGVEYYFQFKNYEPTRRKVTIEIDGAKIGEWIIAGGTKNNPHVDKLERYMESNRKFKTAKVDDPAVADPNNSQNGKVKITVVNEAFTSVSTLLNPYIVQSPPWPGISPYMPSSPMWVGDNLRTTMVGGVLASDSQPMYTSQVNCSLGAVGTRGPECCCGETKSIPTSSPNAPVGTVEGSVSNQQFDTTRWYGDYGTPMLFEFNLKEPTSVGQTPWIQATFCPQCGTRAIKDARFCHVCGVQIAS